MGYERSCKICDKAAHHASLCGGCGKKINLCDGCHPTWIACNEKCLAKWRIEARKGLPKEKLSPPSNVRKNKNKNKGYDLFQKELG